jgi:hypothetical protein
MRSQSHARQVAPRALQRVDQPRRRVVAVQRRAVAYQQVLRAVGAQRVRREEAADRVNAGRAVAQPVEVAGADRLHDHEAALIGQPQRVLLPHRPEVQRDERERRAGNRVDELEVRDAEALGDGLPRAVVIEVELDDAGDVSERGTALDRVIGLERIDEPDLPVDAERVRRSREVVLSHPAEAERVLVERPDRHVPDHPKPGGPARHLA